MVPPQKPLPHHERSDPQDSLTATSRMSSRRADDVQSEPRFALAIVVAGGLWMVLWAAACLSARVSGSASPAPSLVAPFAALLHPGDPAFAWRTPVGNPLLYWATTMLLVVTATSSALLFQRIERARAVGSRSLHGASGTASIKQVRQAAGAKRLRQRARTLRPGTTGPTPRDLGHCLGQSRGVACYSSVEDSVVVLGPPRSGKGIHLAIPMILDAPGAVIATSTRPDNLTATLEHRTSIGPVAVFDPQGLAPGIPSQARWSPIRGCEDPQVAMVRARALTAGTSKGVTDASFWQASSELAVRCLLHAAALDSRGPADVYRWSLSAVEAREAVMILGTRPNAAPAWHQALEAMVTTDPRQRDSVWAMVTIAFACLGDPKVLDAVSPRPDEVFDPQAFLRHRGTVYLLGTSTGSSTTSGLVGAFVEDVVEAARRIAAQSANARLDPPLSLILDEAANYPLPSLPSLMSDGGGTGICTVVVLQSLAQGRAVWGEHAASAIWDAAIVKVILGGGSNARDLEDLSRLIGQRAERTTSTSTGPQGGRSTSISTTQVPILEPAKLRTLPFGTAILLLRSAPPIVLTIRPWTKRRDAKQLIAARRRLEEAISHAEH
jgi:type IV secretion system protein VirD4